MFRLPAFKLYEYRNSEKVARISFFVDRGAGVLQAQGIAAKAQTCCIVGTIPRPQTLNPTSRKSGEIFHEVVTIANALSAEPREPMPSCPACQLRVDVGCEFCGFSPNFRASTGRIIRFGKYALSCHHYAGTKGIWFGMIRACNYLSEQRVLVLKGLGSRVQNTILGIPG